MNYDINQIADALKKIDIFEEGELNDDNIDAIWEEICDNTCYNDSNTIYRSGATKFVIIPNNTDYVIKIPYMTTSTDNSYYYDGSDHQWHSTDMMLMPLNHEYCNVEAENYNMAKELYSGAELFLAKTERVYTGKKINGYVQERVSNFYDWCEKNNACEHDLYTAVENAYKNYDKNSSISEVMDTYEDIPALWYDQLFQYAVKYDKMVEVEKFFQFLIDSDINDLCARNIGFIGDRPVLMDYSGWDD